MSEISENYKWFQKALEIERSMNACWHTEYLEVLATALEATDKDATERERERCAEIARVERTAYSRVAADTTDETKKIMALGIYAICDRIAAAIRKGTHHD